MKPNTTHKHLTWHECREWAADQKEEDYPSVVVGMILLFLITSLSIFEWLTAGRPLLVLAVWAILSVLTTAINYRFYRAEHHQVQARYSADSAVNEPYGI